MHNHAHVEDVRAQALLILDREHTYYPVDRWESFRNGMRDLFEKRGLTDAQIDLYARAAVAQRCNEGQTRAQRLYFDYVCHEIERLGGMNRERVVTLLRENIVQDGPSFQPTPRQWLDAASDLVRYYEDRLSKHDLCLREDGGYY